MDLDVGDVVWAKMKGYSFWPAVITQEASTGLFKKGNFILQIQIRISQK